MSRMAGNRKERLFPGICDLVAIRLFCKVVATEGFARLLIRSHANSETFFPIGWKRGGYAVCRFYATVAAGQ